MTVHIFYILLNHWAHYPLREKVCQLSKKKKRVVCWSIFMPLLKKGPTCNAAPLQEIFSHEKRKLVFHGAVGIKNTAKTTNRGPTAVHLQLILAFTECFFCEKYFVQSLAVVPVWYCMPKASWLRILFHDTSFDCIMPGQAFVL